MPAVDFRIIKRGEEDYVVSYQTPKGEEKTLEVGLVMMATGRKPRTKALGLEVRLMPWQAAVCLGANVICEVDCQYVVSNASVVGLEYTSTPTVQL